MYILVIYYINDMTGIRSNLTHNIFCCKLRNSSLTERLFVDEDSANDEFDILVGPHGQSTFPTAHLRQGAKMLV